MFALLLQSLLALFAIYTSYSYPISECAMTDTSYHVVLSDFVCPIWRCIDFDLAYPVLWIDCWLIELYMLSVALLFSVFYLFHLALSHSILSFAHVFTTTYIYSTLFRSLIVCPVSFILCYPIWL